MAVDLSPFPHDLPEIAGESLGINGPRFLGPNLGWEWPIFLGAFSSPISGRLKFSQNEASLAAIMREDRESLGLVVGWSRFPGDLPEIQGPLFLGPNRG